MKQMTLAAASLFGQQERGFSRSDFPHLSPTDRIPHPSGSRCQSAASPDSGSSTTSSHRSELEVQAMNAVKIPEVLPLVLSVPELATVLHIGRNAAYDLVNTGKIRSIRIGKNIRIPQSALLDYLNSAN